MSDGLSTLYQDLLSGSYDCVDRIVLNAYFRMGHDPGGFRLWWRQLTGSDATLDNAHMMRLAGRFGRRIRGYAKANDIPVVNCSAGERKHLTDIIKMVAYQAESDLVMLLRPYYARVDQEGRTLLHELFAATGDIRVSDSELHITLAPLSSPHRTLAASGPL